MIKNISTHPPQILSHSHIITVVTDSREAVPAIMAVHSAGEGSPHQMRIWQISL